MADFWGVFTKDIQGFVGEVSQRFQQNATTTPTSQTTPKTDTNSQKSQSQTNSQLTSSSSFVDNNRPSLHLTTADNTNISSNISADNQDTLASKTSHRAVDDPFSSTNHSSNNDDNNNNNNTALASTDLSDIETSPTPQMQSNVGDNLHENDKNSTIQNENTINTKKAKDKDNEEEDRSSELHNALQKSKQLEQDCEKLKLLNNALKTHLTQSMGETKKLKEEYSSHLINYENQLEKKNEQITTLTKKTEELVDEKNVLNKQLNDSQLEIKQLNQHIVELSNNTGRDEQLNQQKDLIDNLKAKITKITNKAREQRTQIQELSKIQANLNSENTTLKENNTILNDKLLELQQKYESISNKTQTHDEQQYERMKEQIHNLETENRILSELVEKLKQESKQISEEGATATNEGEESEILRTKEECAKLKEIVDRLGSEVKQYTEIIKQQAKTIEARESQLEKYSINYSQLQQAHNLLQTQFQTYQQKMEEELRSKADSQIGSNNEIKQLLEKKTKELEEVMREGQEWANKCSELEKRVRKMKETAGVKENEIANLQAKVATQENRITELLESLAKQNEDSGSVAEKNKLLQTHNTELKGQIAQNNQKINELNEKIKALETERDEYVQMIEQKEAEISKYQVQIRDARQNAIEYQSTQEKESVMLKEIKELRQEIVRLECRGSAREERLIKERDEEKQMRQLAEKRNEELASEIPSATRPLLRQIESLRAAHSHKEKIWNELEISLRKRISDLENEINELLSNKATLENQCENLRSEQNKHLIQLNNLRSENKELRGKCDTLNDQMDNLSIKYEDISMEYNMHLNKLKKLETEKKSLEENLHQSFEQFELNKNKWEETLGNERAKKNSLEKTINILQSKINEYESLAAKKNANSEHPITHSSTDTENKFENTTSKDLLDSLFEYQEGNETIEGATESKNTSMNTMSPKDYPDASKKKINDANVWTVSRISNELRQKDAELESIKQRLNYLQHSNDQLSDEIVKLKSENESLLKYEQRCRNMSYEVAQLSLRYEAAVDIIVQKDAEIKKLMQRVA